MEGAEGEERRDRCGKRKPVGGGKKRRRVRPKELFMIIKSQMWFTSVTQMGFSSDSSIWAFFCQTQPDTSVL